jgi:hypothetical protein
MGLNKGVKGGHRQRPIVCLEGFDDRGDLHCGFHTFEAESCQGRREGRHVSGAVWKCHSPQALHYLLPHEPS